MDALAQAMEIDGLVKNSQCNFLYDLAKTIDKELYIVEIGSWRGKSTCCLGLGSLNGNRAPVIAIDLWRKHRVKRYNAEEHFRAFLSNIKRFDLKDIVTYIEGDSYSASKSWNSNDQIGLLFIDGDHSYNSVSCDFNAWFSYVIPEGYVVFHDYQPRFPGVFQFVNERIKEKDIDYVSQSKCLLVSQKKGESL